MSYDEEIPEEYEVTEEDVLAGEANNVLARETRTISHGGLRRGRVRLRFIAACGHLIHSLDEVGGVCQHKNCSALVCRNCFKACERCMKLLCPKHQKLHKGMILCPTCKMLALLLGLSPSNTRQQSSSQRNSISSLLFSYPVYQRWNSSLYDIVYLSPDRRLRYSRERRESYG
ncbi:MAG: hypothetical protein ACUVTD_05270 [Nitrososphaerales archaeon]